MDGENSYESDISESWSLIDINLNEESVSVTNAQAKSEETYLPDPKDGNLIKSDSTEIEDLIRPSKDLHKPSHSDSGLLVEKSEGLERNESDSGSEQDKNDSCDAESIEILDADGNHLDSEIERLEICMIDSQELKNSAYQSDDEEQWSRSCDNKIRSTSLTVIKRKRNLNRNSESSDLNSDFISNENTNLSDCLSDERKLKVFSSPASNLPVYKHYRNNVVNTVLSLSVGVVFAGVACIAIGHFLGVHDASETAVELVDTLKKLQLENVALQSRLFKLNRAVLKRDINSKLDLSATKLHETVPCEEKSNYGPERTKTTDATPPDIQPSLKSIQRLTNLEEKGEKEDIEMNFSAIGKYIQDQINVLNNKKIEGFKLVEDYDKKILKVLQKSIQRLSASQENIEKLYCRLIRLKDKINHKLGKLFSDKPVRKAPVTENDLNSIRWHRNAENPEKSSKSIHAFDFPQPEYFYKMKNNSVPGGERIENNIKEEKSYRRGKQEGKRRRKCEKKVKKEKSKGVKSQIDEKMNGKTIEKVTGKKCNGNELRQKKNSFEKFNGMKESCKRFLKFEKRKVKRVKKMGQNNKKKKKRCGRVCSGNECFNLTGFWVFKYADGREEFRRHQTLSDWQFERAKSRKEQRDEDDVESWQFKRALARENGRKTYRWRPERYRKSYDSQDFFHEGFSWI